MKNVKTTAYAATGLGLLALSNMSVYAIDGNKFKEHSTGANDIYSTGDNIVDLINQLLTYFFGLLYFIAVLYGVWGGFNILTAGGDEEKVKKGRTIIIQAIIGLIVIFLVGAIINLVMRALGASA